MEPHLRLNYRYHYWRVSSQVYLKFKNWENHLRPPTTNVSKQDGFPFDFAQGGEPVEPRIRHPGLDPGPE
jgi:hypothetical protein